MYLVYLLQHQNLNRTYLGITNNLSRRIRQHNGEIKGGARATKIFLKQGFWYPIGVIYCQDKRQALSRERTLKNLHKKGKGDTALDKRLYLINQLNYQFVYLLKN